ncbi:hypothetical protein C7Y47_11940 [Lysinibacillus sphaericus]|uniref:Nucleotidyltransferase domain-containing protein n=1 Tax=Lysinibacillus sphaericus TaxID=1421 RepID=A0A544UIG2_LYSSH|nr:hypothetical protein [Lysinibacillus sp. SDF0037]TQR32828.1 hypothetical protein C7Y47_11940 [Lysinibacillus sp. SDF0037]
MIELLPISKKIAKEKILEKVNFCSNDFVFLSGSLIQGIGNTKSDLDVFVVVNDFERLKSDPSIVYDHNALKISFEDIEGIGCDIEYWSLSTVNSLLKQLNSIDFSDSTKRTLNLLSIDGTDFEHLSSFLHRFIVSEPIYNEHMYGEYKAEINMDNYFRLMARCYINTIDNTYDDIMGNLIKGEQETSLILAKNTLITAVSVYLYSRKISLDREKWAYTLLKKHSDLDNESQKILMQFNELYFGGDTDLTYEKKIEDCLYFINNVVNKAGKNLGGM